MLTAVFQSFPVKAAIVSLSLVAFSACAPKKSPPAELAPKPEDMSKLFKSEKAGMDYTVGEEDKALEKAIAAALMDVQAGTIGTKEGFNLTLTVKIKDSSVLPEHMAAVSELVISADVTGDGQTVEGVMEGSQDAVKAKMRCDKGCKRVAAVLSVLDQSKDKEEVVRRAGYGFDVVKVPGSAKEPLWKKNADEGDKK